MGVLLVVIRAKALVFLGRLPIAILTLGHISTLWGPGLTIRLVVRVVLFWCTMQLLLLANHYQRLH
jgi:hypothetical protein